MRLEDLPAGLMDRWRAQIRAAGIPAGDDELERIVAEGHLLMAAAFEARFARAALDVVPDYLAGATSGQAATAAGRSGAAARPSGPVVAEPAAYAASGGAEPSIAELARRLRRRETSPVELTERALRRIVERDRELNAFQLVLPERALAAARRAERELAAGDDRGPLHGLPIALKDLFDLAGVPTAAGSRILGERVAERDSAVAERLEQAGAVIVGKTRLPEFAYSPGADNPHFGPTLNPWNRDHEAGGSSSGSAVAVATGMAVAGIGSDTGGSIRIPAACCGLVGLKPTYGRVSLAGAVPLSWSLDHGGPITRGAEDAALVLEALAEPAGAPRSDGVLDRDLHGMRVGVVDVAGAGVQVEEDVEAAVRAAAAALERAGATLAPLSLPELAALRIAGGAIQALEATAYHETRLRERYRELGPFARGRLLIGFAYPAGAFVRAQQARATLRASWTQRWDGFDLTLLPVLATAPPARGTVPGTAFTVPINVLGWPSATVPIGRTASGLPGAVQVVGRPWRESDVMRAAAALSAGAPA